MRRVLVVILVMLSVQLSRAQFTWAQIGVDGLTCSACTRSVEMSIRKLDFVDSVAMNLEHTEGKIIFKKGSKVEIEKIAGAVIDAGFSLRYLHAAVILKDVKISDNYCYSFEGNSYQFVKTENKTLNGESIIKFLGAKYLSGKEFKSWKPSLKSNCTGKKAKVYFVTV